MRSTATALYWLVISAGSYTSSLLVVVIHKYSNWLPDDLDEGKLEYFYWIVTGLQVLNLGFFGVCCKYYIFKPLQVRAENEGVKLSKV